MERFIKLPYSVLDTLKGEQLLRYIDLLRMVDWRTGDIDTSYRKLGEKWEITQSNARLYILKLQTFGLVEIENKDSYTSIHINQFQTKRQTNNRPKTYKGKRYKDTLYNTPNDTEKQ